MPRKSNPHVKIANELSRMTPEQEQELYKCQDDPIYCIRTYFSVKHPTKGLVPFDLYPYQEEVIRRAQTNRYNIILFPRQSGKCSVGETKLTLLDRLPNQWLGKILLFLLKC